MAQTHRPATDGEKVRNLRYRRGLTVDDVVQRLKDHHQKTVHANHLRNIESGNRNAGATLLFALAAVLGVNVDDLLVNSASHTAKQIAAFAPTPSAEVVAKLKTIFSAQA